MLFLKNLLFLSTGALAAAVTATAPAPAQSSTSASSIPPTLNVTTIGARNNASTLECWALEPGFAVSPQPGTAGAAMLPIGTLGGNGSYSVVPAGFDGGRHNAPAAQ